MTVTTAAKRTSEPRSRVVHRAGPLEHLTREQNGQPLTILVQRCLRCDDVVWEEDSATLSYELGGRVPGRCRGRLED